jgi:IclR family transcriptional regulator, blcABC operon repressor
MVVERWTVPSGAREEPDSMSQETSERRPSGVPAVGKAVRILEVLSAERRPLNLTQISSISGIAKSSAFALCQSLARERLIERNPAGQYVLGARLFEFGSSVPGVQDLSASFHQVLGEVDAAPDETIVLSVLDQSDVIYLAQRVGRKPVGISYTIGMRLPASCTASGKALLSRLTDDQVRDLYSTSPPPQLTERSIGTADALLKALATVRRRQFAIDNEESMLGMTCVGVPIIGAGGHAVAAVAVSMRKEVFREKKDTAAEWLMMFAQKVYARSAGAWPANGFLGAATRAV